MKHSSEAKFVFCSINQNNCDFFNAVFSSPVLNKYKNILYKNKLAL